MGSEIIALRSFESEKNRLPTLREVERYYASGTLSDRSEGTGFNLTKKVSMQSATD